MNNSNDKREELKNRYTEVLFPEATHFLEKHLILEIY